MTIDCRDVRVLRPKDYKDKAMVLWYVESCTPEYKTVRQVDLSNLRSVKCIEFTGGKNIYNAKFDSCYDLVEFKYSGIFHVEDKSMSSMFYNCYSLTSLDVSNWDVSSVTNMSSLFSGCYSLTSLDVSNWDVSSVTDMDGMFLNCYSLTSLDVSNWDVSSVTDMGNLFNNCYSLGYLDVSNWDVSSVTDMGNLFSSCKSLTSLDVSNWDVSSVTNMGYIFAYCAVKNLDLTNWDIHNVTDFKSSFYTEQVRTLGNIQFDLRNFKNVSNYSSPIYSMFHQTKFLESLDLILPDSEDITSTTFFPMNMGTYSPLSNFVNLSLTIPRPTFALKITLGTSSTPSYKLEKLKITGQNEMDFTASSPQIVLDHTYSFKDEQINEFFTNLPTVTNSPTISLKGNPHAGYANMGIALEKGWNVLYDSAANSASIIPLGDEEQQTNSPLVYCFIPGEDGMFVDMHGNKCNLLYSKAVATKNMGSWQILPTFEDALIEYGIEVAEEYQEEIAREILNYANDNSLMIRYNIWN